MLRVGFLAIAAACSGGGGGTVDANGGDSPTDQVDANIDSPPDAPACVATVGNRIRLPGTGDDGEFDPSLAVEPGTARVWMAYSSTSREASGLVRVSTRLAYSDDAGAMWCDGGTINPSIVEPTPPPEYAAHVAYWNHEVSDLVYDSSAPPARRWLLVWHRVLTVDDRAPVHLKVEYSWIAARAAASPLALAAAPEEKLAAGAAYAATGAIAAYNNARGGAPAVRIDQLDAAAATCAGITEPATHVSDAGLQLALYCASGAPATSAIVLVQRANGVWSFRSRLAGLAEAQAFNAALNGFSAPEIVVRGAATWLLLTPTVDNVYGGCLGYALDLDTATIASAPGFGISAQTSFGGACTFHESLGARGALYSEAHLGEQPTFHMISTGTAPPL